MSTTFLPLPVCEEDFARSLGFETFDDLIDASEPLFSPVGELWFVAPLSNGDWLAWLFPDYDDIHEFDSYEAALDFVQPGVLV
ncbi:MAG: hypothetical protein SH850_22435 [Planctomycetaceae bacterium]|nr:hypothetical protein [Planctomycetaceae bacterium]